MSASNTNSNGRAVQRARVEAGLSQLQLALRAGISRWRLRLAEQGFCKLRRGELWRIRRVLERSHA